MSCNRPYICCLHESLSCAISAGVKVVVLPNSEGRFPSRRPQVVPAPSLLEAQISRDIPSNLDRHTPSITVFDQSS